MVISSTETAGSVPGASEHLRSAFNQPFIFGALEAGPSTRRGCRPSGRRPWRCPRLEARSRVLAEKPQDGFPVGEIAAAGRPGGLHSAPDSGLTDFGLALPDLRGGICRMSVLLRLGGCGFFLAFVVVRLLGSGRLFWPEPSWQALSWRAAFFLPRSAGLGGASFQALPPSVTSVGTLSLAASPLTLPQLTYGTIFAICERVTGGRRRDGRQGDFPMPAGAHSASRGPGPLAAFLGQSR